MENNNVGFDTIMDILETKELSKEQISQAIGYAITVLYPWADDIPFMSVKKGIQATYSITRDLVNKSTDIGLPITSDGQWFSVFMAVTRGLESYFSDTESCKSVFTELLERTGGKNNIH